ncbi:hypothetical protein EDB86DRAFT_2829233 [Lactarius hatsudake]|nr:hypothetical protein EDB86DRAFT_2829233 [Lactarius hatsudake]
MELECDALKISKLDKVYSHLVFAVLIVTISWHLVPLRLSTVHPDLHRHHLDLTQPPLPPRTHYDGKDSQDGGGDMKTTTDNHSGSNNNAKMITAAVAKTVKTPRQCKGDHSSSDDDMTMPTAAMTTINIEDSQGDSDMKTTTAKTITMVVARVVSVVMKVVARRVMAMSYSYTEPVNPCDPSKPISEPEPIPNIMSLDFKSH